MRAGHGRNSNLAAFLACVPFLAALPGGFQGHQALLHALLPLVALSVLALTARVAQATTTDPGLLMAGAVFLAMSAVSALSSDSLTVAIVGNSGRMTGLASLALMFSLAWCGLVLGARPTTMKETVRWLTLAGLVVSVGSLLQKLGVLLPGYPELGPSGRVLGPMGSASQLGAVMLLFIACAVSTLLDDEAPATWRRTAAAAAAPMVLVLVLTGSRAAWVGAFVGLSTSLLHPSIRGLLGDARRRLTIATAACLATMVALVVPVTRGRLFSLFDAGGGTVRGRLDIWKGAVPAWTDRWVLGWGLDQSRAPIMHRLATDFETTYGSVETVDRAHSVLLDQLLWGGVIGLIALCVLAIAWWRGLRVRTMEPSRIVLVLGLVAFAVHLSFNFPVPETDALAWLIAGLLAGSAATRRNAVRDPMGVAVHAVMAAATLPVLFIGVVNLRSDRLVHDALRLEARGDVAALDRFDRAASGARFLPLYQEVAARAFARAGDTERALGAARRALDLNPSDPILIELELRTRAQIAFGKGDEVEGARLVPLYESLCDRYPSRVSFVVGLALARMTSGDIDGARTTAAEASRRAPRDPSPEQVLALIERTAGNEQAAAEHEAEARRREALPAGGD